MKRARAGRSRPGRSTQPQRKGLKFEPVASVKASRAWTIYGRPGTGKTTFASTFPKPILVVDIKDEGTDSIRDVKGVQVFRPTTWQELDDLYWHLKSNPGEFKTVVIDTVTNAQSLLINEVSNVGPDQMPGDWGTMTKQKWGEVSSRLKRWITDMRDLGLEMVFIAQERVFGLDDDAVIAEGEAVDPEVGPRLSPATMSHLCAASSVVACTCIAERKVESKVKGRKPRIIKEYSIRLGPNAYYITKLRKPRDVEIPEFLGNPTYGDVIAIINGE